MEHSEFVHVMDTCKKFGLVISFFNSLVNYLLKKVNSLKYLEWNEDKDSFSRIRNILYPLVASQVLKDQKKDA